MIDKMMEVLQKKSRLEYEMNSVEKYIKGGDFDASLEASWEKMKSEKDLLDKELSLLENPATSELQARKLDLLAEVKEHEAEIDRLNRQIHFLDRQIDKNL